MVLLAAVPPLDAAVRDGRKDQVDAPTSEAASPYRPTFAAVRNVARCAGRRCLERQVHPRDRALVRGQSTSHATTALRFLQPQALRPPGRAFRVPVVHETFANGVRDVNGRRDRRVVAEKDEAIEYPVRGAADTAPFVLALDVDERGEELVDYFGIVFHRRFRTVPTAPNIWKGRRFLDVGTIKLHPSGVRESMLRWLGAFALALTLFLPAGQAVSGLLTVPPGSTAGSGSPHEMAFDAVERLRNANNRLPSEEDSSVFSTKDQMIALLVYLARAERFPDRSEEFQSIALAIWDAADVAYDRLSEFYDVALTIDSFCVLLETNAWALLASDNLARATGRSEHADRARNLAETISSVISTGRANGTPRCPVVEEVALPLWALMAYAKSTPSAGWARSAALAELDAQLDSRFENGARALSGRYFPLVNAQFLLALQLAAEAVPNRYGAPRIALSNFISDHLLDDRDGDLVAASFSFDEASRESTEAFDPAAQWWMAFALHNQQAMNHSSVSPTDASHKLISGGFARSWSTDQGGVVNARGVVGTELTALLALFTEGPIISDILADGPRFGVVVPARDMQYPARSSAEIQDFVVINEWTFRFDIEPWGPPSQEILLPLSRLGPIIHDSPAATSELFRAGVSVDVITQGIEFPFLRFQSPAGAPTTYRLVDRAPLFPIESRIREDLRIFVGSSADEESTPELLRFEIEVSDVAIEQVRFNERVLTSVNYTWTEVAATESLPRPHVRLDLRGQKFPAMSSNEISVVYSDVVPPVVNSLSLSLDAGGQLPLRNSTRENAVHFTTSSNAPTFIRVAAKDNAVVRSVFVSYGQGAEARQILLGPEPDEPGIFSGRLPAFPANQRTSVSVHAVDGHGLLSPADPRVPTEFFLEARPPFLQEGNIVLLVFSATLLLGVVSIYFKMGRRTR